MTHPLPTNNQTFATYLLTLQKTITMPEPKKTLSQEFAEFLKTKRMSLGLSQKQLSVKLYGHIRNASYISKIESGEREVSVSTMGFFLEELNSWVQFID